MKLPFIVIIDDDTQVLRAIQRDVRNKFREDYKVLATESASEALGAVKELKLKNETVALFISDQRMPEMEGTEFLGKTQEFFPDAKKVLLTAYSDIEAAIKAINTLRLDYYLLKPWTLIARKCTTITVTAITIKGVAVAYCPSAIIRGGAIARATPR